MYSLKEMPATASTLFSAYASLSAFIMLLRSMANDVVPPGLRSYLYSALHRLFTPVSPTLTLVIDELSGMARNEVYDAAQIYLRTKISPATDRLRVSKTPRQKHLCVAIEKGGEIDDKFENLDVKWRFIRVESKDNYSGENRSLELSFNKKFKDTVLISYLPYIQLRAKAIKEEEKVINLYSRDCPCGDDDEGGAWGSIHLEHPSTFDTLAMDPDLKKAIVDDLDRFLRRKEFYKKVGKAWKRGYLLFGPPGTGKSSLVAAMANYLRFDVYDLELTSVYGNSALRRILLSTTNRSILVIEDIDCGVQMQNREDSDEGEVSHNKFTLSGLLNFIDGLWSSCGDKRIIVFTTNHKDRLDPVLLRPGRMDMHINMSYLTRRGFKTLASNYHDIHLHSSNTLYAEIEGLLDSTKVTPAEVAEELMKSDNADIAFGELVNFLKRKKPESDELENKVANKIEDQYTRRREEEEEEKVLGDGPPSG